ncbi:putative ATP-dependent RNA helicase NDAI_0C02490 [Naumovozyma dairenensis CBS 421]|uniref:ATP-dependent RNA helicase DRS1 n=1 Tax=Naumovozyma dairenensis (strain ATCC 10597 / BCRC 20456 / CBS 421 / NBRC 0211 / NRRL Y-12639) TaxID=1071378 RepID=G0W7Z8_NAUDC|nr:hypothetical protein NDAI_0C02490 [Naumovozyma dairenensis CBS 421]CCD23909.1 hypothetical protein NDAI_0C02490 [Naumovozyma dairenensis CBS 421]
MKRNFKNLDFVPTISDSEDDIPDLDDNSDVESQIEVKSKKSIQKKNKKNIKKKQEKADSNNDNANEDVHDDLNENFQFNLDNDDEFAKNANLQSWDFMSNGDNNGDEPIRKDVDLEKIIRRKGGLIKLARVEGDDEDDEEEEGEEIKDVDENSEKQPEYDEDEGEDELAMDGFGMGAKKIKEDQYDEEDEDEDDNDDDQEERESSDEDNSIHNDEEEKEEGEDEDTAEEVAKFYAPEAEGDDAKKQTHTSFNTLSLSRPVLKGLANLGYNKPSPIQSATIPIALLGKDIIAGAVTGSGKTAAFMIPIIERLLFKPAKVSSTRVIVLTPTRELAIQIADVAKKIGKFVNGLTFGLAVGGLNLRQQEQILKQRPDIVIATPGRFIDHVRNSASFNVDSVEILVMDEADRMLEEGFQEELNEIMQLLPTKRQTMLFSATMNSKIKQLINLSLKKPVRIMINPPKQAASKLTQEFVRIRTRDHLKPALLFNLIKKLDEYSQKRMVVFVARKETAHKLRIILGLLGMNVAELHGSLTQEQRLESVTKFKSLEIPVLICTDLASRGLDIPKIEVVINYDMPKSYDIYLHRVGRTARAGREGRSVSLVGESSNERSIVRDAIKSVEDVSKIKNDGSRALGRQVNWNQVEEINKLVENMAGTVEDVLEEEKQEKEILRAEMQIRKGENLLKHRAEIQARPRRTWFQSETEKKNAKIFGVLAKNKKEVNSKKRKRQEAMEDAPSNRMYKKTQKDRVDDQERTFRKQKKSDGKKKFKKGKK